MRRKSERTVKASPTKKAENTPRRTSRRTRKTPEKSINDEESENNSSDQGSSSENETEEVIAPKRSRRSSRTIEKSSSAEDLKQTRPRRKAATKKDADTIEEDPNEGDQSSAVDTHTQSKNEDSEIGEKPVESSSTENVESVSVDSSAEPTVANDDQTNNNQEQNEIIQTNETIEIPEEKQQQDSKETENIIAETNKDEETPVQSTKPEADQVQPEAPKEKPTTRRRALKRTEKEPTPIEKIETVQRENESESNENVKETNVDETPTEPKPEEDSEANKNTDETKIKKESPQQTESVEDEPKENGEAKEEMTKVAKKPPIVRKRKWLSNKASTPKVQEITISTDSLKGLISDVKPVPLSDVKLQSSPEADHESDDVKVVSSTSLDYNNRRSEERVSESADDAINISTTRKISIVSEPDEQQPLSPAKHNPCNILFITNLVRPFTVLQLKSLLQRTGKIVENGFWMDKIKSKCFVKYETEDEAVETRHALHGIRWPSSNPKCLNVDFGTESLMEKAIESTAGDIKPFSSSRDERVVSSNDLHESNRERIAAERPVREWDLGKKSDLRRSRERDRVEKDHDANKASREKDRDRRRRSASASPSRKYIKKEAEPPLRLLDDLFRKTKTTPCIYWLPLTPEQIAVREEERQKTIQRRLAMKKEREREENEEKERRRQREKRNSHDKERDRRPARENSRDRNRRDRQNDRRRY